MSASNRSLLFLLGLVLGLLAGAGFFIFKMDDLLKNRNIFNSSRDTLIIQQQGAPENTEEKESKSGIKKISGKQSAILITDTTSKTMSSAELFAKKYSREIPIGKVLAEADSLLKDTSRTRPSENFIIRKDELLGSKNLAVTNLQNPETENAADSLLEKISGIKDASKDIVASLKVEFWQSPINYKGYKMTKNKIILFGINPDEPLKLFHTGDVLLMKQNQNYFKLYFTDEFKQFEKITDELLIAKLK